MLFSIITVVLNGARTIERTIRSVVSQKTENVEYIVIDGGSSDGTIEIINRYKKYIDIFISEKDSGLYDAMNKGIKLSHGEYIAFINADDWYEPDSFINVKKHIKNGVNIIYGKVRCFENGVAKGYIGITEPTDPQKLLIDNLYCHQGLFINRDVFDEIGLYDIKFKTFADHEWNLRANKAGYSFFFINETISNYTLGGKSSENTLQNAKEIIEIAACHINDQEKYRNELIELQKKRLTYLRFDYLVKNKPYIYINLDRREQYYLWGAGRYGEKCFELLQHSDIKVKGFIDNRGGNDYNGVRLYHPDDVLDELRNGSKVIVSSSKYEREIVEQLIKMGVKRDCITSFTEFRDGLITQYSDDEWECMLKTI